MKVLFETSSMHLSVWLYLVSERFYGHFKSVEKNLFFLFHVENERSIAKKMRKKILIYTCVNRFQK